MDETDGSDYGDDMLQMVESEDIEFLKGAIHKRSYSLLKRVKQSGYENKPKRKKLSKDDEALEHDYEEQVEDQIVVKSLLPIKTKDGIISRFIEEKEIGETNVREEGKNETIENEAEYILEDLKDSVPKTTVELMAVYNETTRKKKIQIGCLCSSILENPEEKVSHFKTLLNMIDGKEVEAYISIKKLVIISLLEVFKDVLPSYQIQNYTKSAVKLKKETLKRQKYEDAILQHYKNYLQKLEKFTGVFIKKRGDTRTRTEIELKMGELAVRTMCDLLITHPYFNYSPNIAQAVIPFLNNSYPPIRQIVSAACKTIFKEDKKEEITLKILRMISQFLKKCAHNVQPDMLEVLLHLRIKDVNLDSEKEQEMKQKKFMSHKQNVLQLSKKERKRKKRLQEIENQMLETKAEENKQVKQKNLTEITKIVFGIYFRILKSSKNTKVLGVCLEGLSKYSHCINLEYYMDLLNLLNGLLKEEWLAYRERLYCIQIVFAILSDQGDAINLDPTRFYTMMYGSLLGVHASRNYQNFSIVLRTITDMLIKRRKKITNKRLIGFTKRLGTLSLQILHNGSISCLGLIKVILQLNKTVDVLLDLDTSIGDGDYLPEIDDPEYCNATSSSLFEMSLLSRHYHPVVSKYAKHIVVGVPGTGEGSLPPELGKCSPEVLFNNYDMSEMAFNPPIPVPKKIIPKSRMKKIHFTNKNFKQYCNDVIRVSKCNTFL